MLNNSNVEHHLIIYFKMSLIDENYEHLVSGYIKLFFCIQLAPSISQIHRKLYKESLSHIIFQQRH